MGWLGQRPRKYAHALGWRFALPQSPAKLYHYARSLAISLNRTRKLHY
jgi:hypothetical protein